MVYGVFGGEYSDWYAVGYFEDKAEAEAYCEKYNKQKGYWADKLYIIELKNLAKDKATEKVRYRVDTRTWVWDVFPECWEHWSLADGEDGVDGGDVFIYLYPSQLDRIVKIAQDFYAKWKAEKEGII